MPETAPDFSDVPPTGGGPPAPKPAAGLVAKAVPSVVAGLLVAFLAGGVAFYVRASIVEAEVAGLEHRAETHEAAGHRSAARELADLRTDIGRLVEKLSAADRADATRATEIDRRLERIERAIERR